MNSGYIGMRMSVRAADAYNDGKRPISKWNKSNIIDSIQNLKIDIDIERLKKCNLETLKAYCLTTVEWRHTSGAFNKTDFYEIDEEGVEQLKKDGYKNIPKKEKKVDDFEKGYVHGKYKEVEYHPCSRHAKYKESWIGFVNGRKKGDWIYLENGKKKRMSNVKIEKMTKIRKKSTYTTLCK